MSDAALSGIQDESTTAKVHSRVTEPNQPHHQHHHQHDHSKNKGKHAPVAPTLQSEAAITTPDGQTSRITTDGNIIRSDDPTTRPDASMGEKLKGDLKGAVNGTIGSVQAATGIAIRNENLEQKGRDKMAEEDARLGAKHGVMPVGSNLRNEEQ